jgi:hypothetical protein
MNRHICVHCGACYYHLDSRLTIEVVTDVCDRCWRLLLNSPEKPRPVVEQFKKTDWKEPK